MTVDKFKRTFWDDGSCRPDDFEVRDERGECCPNKSAVRQNSGCLVHHFERQAQVRTT